MAAERVAGLGLEPAQREFLVGIDEVDEVVRHLRPLAPSLGLAVPMSMARYTHIESTDTTSATGRRRASSKRQR